MGGDTFLQQFMAGWQMGQQRREGQRRDQMMVMQQQQEAQRAQADAQDRAARIEALKLQKERIEWERKREEFDAKLNAASMTSAQTQMLPPQTEDLGGGTTMEMGPMTAPTPPIMLDVPGGGQVQAPFYEDIQARKEAEQQAKMREALGMFGAQEQIRSQYREKPKTLQEIYAEAQARAAGGRAGAPLASSSSGSMTGEGGKPLLSGEINKFNDFRSGLNTLGRLAGEVEKTGASAKAETMIPGFLTEATGWGTEAKKRQAVLDQAKQVVGKAMEGGVLRKEDEAKYMRILPIISDPPDVARGKLENLKSVMAQDAEIYLETLEAAGRNVTKIRETLGKQLESTSGDVVEWTRGPDGRPRRK